MRSTHVEGHPAIVPTLRGKRDSFPAPNRRARPKTLKPAHTDDSVADSIPGTDGPAAPEDQPHHMTDLEA
jgi:hypothetical protein